MIDDDFQVTAGIERKIGTQLSGGRRDGCHRLNSNEVQ